MTVRAVEGKKPYKGGKAIEITEDKVINLRLRDENNLIIYDEGDNEIYVDLQLPDEITPTDAFPVGVTTGRVIVDNGWDWQGTIVCFKTTSGDNIKLLYADDGKLYIDNGTGTFKQIYLKGEVDALLQALRDYVDQQLALKQDKLIAGDNISIAADGKTISATMPTTSRFLSLWDCSTGQPISFPASTPFEYITGDHFLVETVDTTTNYRPSGTEYTGVASTTVETEDVQVGDLYIYDGTTWLLQLNHDKEVSFANIAGQPTDNTNLATALNAKQDAMVILSYGNSTWNDFITAYQKNGVVYCRASSNSNPATGTQGRLAFMAYVNNATTPTEVEFQYYRSRSDHNTEANQLDQVFVYKLTSASGGTWTVTERNTAAKATAGTGINLTYGSGNMTIANTGVISVNGNTGTVSVNDTKISATAPSSPTEGMVWYDTTNDQLKVYDGTNWNVTGKEYHAGEGIEIGSIQDYSAMQGPAPSGFHVPLKTEWQAVYNIWTALGGGNNDGTNFGIALKLPFAGDRKRGNSNVDNQGSFGYYWSSSRYSANGAYNLYFDSTTLSHQNSSHRAFGYSVRCFKNSPTVPTSSWTKLYGTSIEAGGIFWSSADGLISLSSDGQTWITIADKNLGATTVWNSGDTLSEANAGKYYQWGNNYGFPFTGTVTTSSTQVDASNYGPGNYYSSSTFITRSSSPYRWDTTDNTNLRGGETGVVTLDNAITNTGVLSVNGQTGDVTISGGIQNDTTGTTSTVAKIWAGTEAEYALITPVATTIYYVY